MNLPNSPLKPVMTQREIGAVLGICHQQVNRIEVRALKKLRVILVRRLGRDYFNGAA